MLIILGNNNENRLRKLISKIDKIHFNFLKNWIKNYRIKRQIPYLKTSRIYFTKTLINEWSGSIKNNRKVQNHFHQVHATAMILLAESIAGFLVGMHISDDNYIFVKTIQAKFLKKSVGNIYARAILTNEQINYISNRTRGGKIKIDVMINDDAKNIPLEITIEIAWIKKTLMKR